MEAGRKKSDEKQGKEEDGEKGSASPAGISMLWRVQ